MNSKTTLILVSVLLFSFSLTAQIQKFESSMYNTKNHAQNNVLGPYVNQANKHISNFVKNKKIKNQYLFSNNAPSQLDTSYLYRCVSQSVDIVVTDSFYYMGGRTRSCGNGDIIVLPYINKVDLMGNEIWHRIDSLNYRNHFTNNSKSTLLLSDKSILKFGVSYNDDTLSNDTAGNVFSYFTYLINTNKDNNLIYKRKLCLDSNDGFVCLFTDAIELQSNKEYVSVGYSSSNSYHPHPIYPNYYEQDSSFVTIFKLDSISNIINKKKFFIGTERYNRSDLTIASSTDNGYIIGGHATFANDSNYNPIYNRKYFIIKVDSNFDIKWMKKFGQSKYFLRNILNIVPSKTGGYLFAASYFDDWNANYPGRMWFGKLSENGDLLWSKKVFEEFDSEVISGTLIPYMLSCPMSIVENDNGDIIIGGQTNFDAGPYIYKADSNGNKKFSRWLMPKYLHSSSYIRNMRQAKDKGFVFVGSQHEIDSVGRSAMLIKTDSMGCLLPNCADTLIHLDIKDINKLKKHDIIIYPNPAQNQIQIAINQQGAMVKQIIIYNISGKEILRRTANNYLVNMDISSLAKGVYIVKVESSLGDIRSSKFIKQ